METSQNQLGDLGPGWWPDRGSDSTRPPRPPRVAGGVVRNGFTGTCVPTEPRQGSVLMTEASSSSTTAATDGRTTDAEPLEFRITQTGDALLESLRHVIEQVPGADAGPQRLAATLRVDKVLASRLLKAIRSPDGMSAMHRAPGAAPLHRVLKASAAAGVDTVHLDAARVAIDAFEELIHAEVGDRSGLEAILSAWVPEARRDFELRRKQAAFRALSQLKGLMADSFAETAIFWPSDDGERIDVVWVTCIVGLQRLRPGVPVKFTSRRGVEKPDQRRQRTLNGAPVDTVENTVLEAFSSSLTPTLRADICGEYTHYLLEIVGLGASDAMTLTAVEVNRTAIARFVPVDGADARGRQATSRYRPDDSPSTCSSMGRSSPANARICGSTIPRRSAPPTSTTARATSISSICSSTSSISAQASIASDRRMCRVTGTCSNTPVVRSTSTSARYRAIASGATTRSTARSSP